MTHAFIMGNQKKKYWQKLSGPKLVKLIIAVSALAISYEGMSQGVMGAVNVAPEYGVSKNPKPSCECPNRAGANITTEADGVRG